MVQLNTHSPALTLTVTTLAVYGDIHASSRIHGIQVDNDLVRRSWWFNLADIAQQFDEGQRQTALRAALAVASSDDITRRASQIQKTGDTRARPRYGYGSIRAQ